MILSYWMIKAAVLVYRQIYLEFDKRRKEYEAKEADKQDEQELKALEEAEKKLLGRKK